MKQKPSLAVWGAVAALSFAIVAVPMYLSSDQKNLVSDLNKDKLASAPHFTRDQWQNLSDPSFASKIYQYYGKQAYFETGDALRPTGRTDDKTYPKTQN